MPMVTKTSPQTLGPGARLKPPSVRALPPDVIQSDASEALCMVRDTPAQEQCPEPLASAPTNGG